ncbi:ATP-dependent nuclease [Bacillus toyonensis]|uniref:ATP-dependent nuclease n=1 Tax=Bacillus toyonensis TaxID=155322 RepID=UPI0021CF045F|nr:AAA family ATPase [Bacillus toyonensis]MCU5395962.1 AAA family ATPase [Bacillus toyonensis]
MYISKMVLRNFRNFKEETFYFNKGVNTLIGENGSGKTNAFFALRLLLDNNLPISASRLLESDFNRDLIDWRGHWIVISLTFNELDDSEGAALLAHHLEDVVQENPVGSYHYYFRPKKGVRKKLFELSNEEDKDQDKLQEILKSITINDYEAVFYTRGNADLSDEHTYKTLVGDFEHINFPDPEDEQKDLLGNQTSQIFLLRAEMACTFIKALRNVVAELKKSRQSPLLNLLRGSAKEILLEDCKEISDNVDRLNTTISELKEVQKLSERVKRTLDSTVGYTYAPNVSIKSELPADVNQLLQSLTLWVSDGDDGDYQGKLEDLSLGGANLIYITLKLLEYEYFQPTEDKAAHFLLIEEPEAHIHTHIQKTIFDKYSFANTQVITSTHSTHISSANKIDSINILSKEKNGTLVCHPSNGLTTEECSRIERYLDATRSTLLFAKGVILVEGDAELILIPTMFKKVFGISLDEIGVSVINMSSAVFDHIAKLFNDDRIRRKCAIITDHDKSILPLKQNANEDSEEEKKCRNSQKKGEERKRILDAFCESNSWVEPFYAAYTFEVDFILSKNQNEVINILDKIYQTSAAISKSEELLHSGSVEVAGKEILRLANKVGKGWFALLLAEEMNVNTIIPDYILKAIAFATGHIGYKHLEKMMQYRTKQLSENGTGECKYQTFIEAVAALENEDCTLTNLNELLLQHDLQNDPCRNLINFYEGVPCLVN